MLNSNTKSPLLATALAALVLAACSPSQDNQTAGQKVDSAIGKADEKTSEMADKAKDAIGNATDKTAAKVEDATITASVNAELVKDPALSALKINVDTAQGKVVLRGTAPDQQARARAEQLALAIKGVVSVDNQLEVRS